MFEPRVALASLSGRSDAGWAESAEPHVGAAFLGGIALDAPTRRAARAMVRRDREEFLPGDPVRFVDGQLARLQSRSLLAAFNVRATSSAPIRRVARICRTRNAAIEINAHCRQAEMCEVGAGESLLRDGDRLRELVSAAADERAITSVKVRAEVPEVDLVDVARLVESAGGDVLHVDAMDSEPIVERIASAVDLFVIANNGVRDARSTEEYLRYGADAVSVGRASDDPATLARVRDAVDRWRTERPIEP